MRWRRSGQSRPANRAAVVAFAGRGVLRCPLTENLVRCSTRCTACDRGIRPGGTDLGAALDAAIEAVETEEHAQGRAIVVFSDGEDHADRWALANGTAPRAKDRGSCGRHRRRRRRPPGPGGKTDGPAHVSWRAGPLATIGYRTGSHPRRTGGMIVKLGLASVDLGKLYETRIEPLARRRRGASWLNGPSEVSPVLARRLRAFGGRLPAGRPQLAIDVALDLELAAFAEKPGPFVALLAAAGLATGAGEGHLRPRSTRGPNSSRGQRCL